MYKIARKHYKILGVSILSKSKGKLLREVRQKILQNQKFLIVTPNPEHIIRAQTDPVFRRILNKAEISVPDGIGLSVAVKFLSLPMPTKNIFRPLALLVQGLRAGLAIILNRNWLESEVKVIKGREFFLEVIKLANKKGWKVVLVGDRKKSSEKAAAKLKLNYKKVKLSAFEGPNLDGDGNPLTAEDEVMEKDLILEINRLKPQFLILGFGAPKQEKWAFRWKNNLNVNGTMVVGGAFNYIAGTTKLPPEAIENLGLEWLWRLITGSQKFGRIRNATVVFPYKVFLQKLNR